MTGLDVDDRGNYKRCPNCGSLESVDYDEIGWNNNGTITLLWYCTGCGAQWDDVYLFVRRENMQIHQED